MEEKKRKLTQYEEILGPAFGPDDQDAAYSSPPVAPKTEGSNEPQSSEKGTTPPSDDKKSPYLPQGHLDATLNKLRRIAEAAATGDAVAMDKLRVQLDRSTYIWEMLGDLNRDFEDALVQAVAPGDSLKSECVRKKASKMRSAMYGVNSSMLTRLAAGRVISASLLVQFVSTLFVQSPEAPELAKRLEQIQRHYTSAIRAYAMARKLDFQLIEARDRIAKSNLGSY